MNEKDKEIWLKYIKNYKVYNYIEKFNITIKFNGEFSYNYPVYIILKEYDYIRNPDDIWYYKYILKYNNCGVWSLKIYKEEKYIINSFVFYNNNIFPDLNIKGNICIWFNNYFEEVKKLLLCSNDKSIVNFLSENIKLPLEIIYIISSFLRLCEIKYIKKLLK